MIENKKKIFALSPHNQGGDFFEEYNKPNYKFRMRFYEKTFRFNNDNYKQSQKPPVGLWAPGNYTCVCSICNKSFLGDKRAQHCADCA